MRIILKANILKATNLGERLKWGVARRAALVLTMPNKSLTFTFSRVKISLKFECNIGYLLLCNILVANDLDAACNVDQNPCLLVTWKTKTNVTIDSFTSCLFPILVSQFFFHWCPTVHTSIWLHCWYLYLSLFEYKIESATFGCVSTLDIHNVRSCWIDYIIDLTQWFDRKLMRWSLVVQHSAITDQMKKRWKWRRSGIFPLNEAIYNNCSYNYILIWCFKRSRIRNYIKVEIIRRVSCCSLCVHRALNQEQRKKLK